MMAYFDKLGQEYKTILHYVALLTIGVSVIELLPVIVLIASDGSLRDYLAFLIPGVGGISLGCFLYLGTQKHDRYSSMKTWAVIVTLTWAAAVILGALPFVIGKQLSSLNAIFEATSGWTTTGLSVMDVKETPQAYLLWRSLMQFVGGAGIAVLMLAAVIGPEARGLYEAEARTDRFMPSVVDTSRILIKLYLGYFIIGVLLYWLAGLTAFDAVNHSMAALSTGGFSTRAESIGYWNSIPVEVITIGLMILGTTNFSIHYGLIWRRQIKSVLDSEVILFLLFMGIVVPLIMYALINTVYHGLGQTFRIALFQAVSALSTSGFQTVPFSNWNATAIIFIIVLMIIGGGTGATAGGLKLYRIAIFLKNIYWSIEARLYPKNAVVRHCVYRQGEKTLVKTEHIMEVLTYISLYIITYFTGVVVLMLSGFDLRDSLFEFASAMSTVGLSVGVTGPHMPVFAKVAEIIGMWLGRLEFLAVIIAGVKIFKDLGNMANLGSLNKHIQNN